MNARRSNERLRTARLARRGGLRALAAGVGLAAALPALGTRRLRLLRRRRSFRSFGAFLSVGRFLPAEPIGRRAQAAAHALRLLLLRRRGLLRLGVRVELAADELDLRHFGAVAAAVAEAQ